MTVLVTGGGGFLGGAIVQRLVEQGAEVRSFSRARHETLDALGADQIRGDLADTAAVAKAVSGCDAVFHVAAKAGVWGSRESYYRPNVQGTENVIAACREHGVPRLIYTSTPSVAFHGRNEEGVDESIAYPDRFLCHYAETKAIAERKVLEANDPALATVALRPHLIWGPGDTNLVPRIVERARRGKLKLVGAGDNLVDSTFIGNAAQAHLCAANALAPGAPCAGKPYFITNGEPLPMRELINKILDAAGLPPVTRHVPPKVAYAAGWLLEQAYGVLGKQEEPMMTRFVALQLSTAHWFDIRAAERDLGFRPAVSVTEGMGQLRAAFVKI